MAGRWGVRAVEHDAYRAGFMLRLAWVGIADVLALFTHETYWWQVVRQRLTGAEVGRRSRPSVSKLFTFPPGYHRSRCPTS